MMRAVQIEGGVGPSSALYIGEIERPVPKEGEVLVKARARPPATVPRTSG
jgi:NADPH:quinone reductase-like Zn-dependent oxidoreductase